MIQRHITIDFLVEILPKMGDRRYTSLKYKLLDNEISKYYVNTVRLNTATIQIYKRKRKLKYKRIKIFIRMVNNHIIGILKDES